MLNCNRFEYKRCRYQKPQKVKNNSFLGATISHHVRKFGESMPHRPTMRIVLGPQSGVKKQTISTISKPLHFFPNLLLRLLISLFTFTCELIVINWSRLVKVSGNIILSRSSNYTGKRWQSYHQFVFIPLLFYFLSSINIHIKVDR